VNSVLAYGRDDAAPSDVVSYIANGKTQTGEDRDGNKISWMDITYETINESTGQREGGLETAQVFTFNIKLSNGQTVVAYPWGYGIDGEQSPVSGYPY
jgi:hypothetical protein